MVSSCSVKTKRNSAMETVSEFQMSLIRLPLLFLKEENKRQRNVEGPLLGVGLADFFCRGTESQYSSPCVPDGLGPTYSTTFPERRQPRLLQKPMNTAVFWRHFSDETGTVQIRPTLETEQEGLMPPWARRRWSLIF